MRSGPVLAVVLAAVLSISGSGAEASGNPHAVTLGEARAAISAGALPVSQAPTRSAATWCGTPARADLRPNTLSGFPVHWMYVLPSDAPDRFSTFAGAMQTDADAIDAWWRREDPTRTPRNDLTQLSCGAQLDLTTLRLPQSSATLAAQDGRFVTLFDALLAANFRSPFTKYIVYFDGRVDGAGHLRAGCEQLVRDRGRSRVRPGVRRRLDGCRGAHEFLHTLGAVSRSAPHNCPEPNGGHSCESPADLMYPFLDALRSTRRSSIPAATTTTGMPAASPTPRTLPGSCSSIVSSRSR